MYGYLVLALIGGVVISLVFARPVRNLRSWLRARAPLIKKYWKFVVPFVILNILGYTLIILFMYDDKVITIFGQISATIFAIFVGNIAFSEFGESKFEKLLDSARQSFQLHEFVSARAKLEEAHSIKPSDCDVLADLLEVYLITGMYDKFDNKIDTHARLAIEEREQIIHSFLQALRPLMVEHMREARENIMQTIKITQDNPHLREAFAWSIDELLASNAYRLLGVTTQQTINNYFAYLMRQLQPEQERRFIDGYFDEVDIEQLSQSPLMPNGAATGV